MKVLYIFISCQNRINQCYNRIINMMKNLNIDSFIIILGGYSINDYIVDKHILKLNCNDYYEGLPEKVIKTFKYINDNEELCNYSHYCKIDDDIIIKKNINTSLSDYCCSKVKRTIDDNEDRTWHMYKCHKDSNWNYKEYTGDYKLWCLGGDGYIISNKSLKIICNEYILDEMNYSNEIYEDVYIAKLLHKNNIFPKKMKKLNNYIYSSEHFKFLNTIIIIPFRPNKDSKIRQEQLEYFISNTVPLFQKNIPNSKVIIIEQDFTNNLFNRGQLINIGINEYRTQASFIITHDVDINPSEEIIKKHYLSNPNYKIIDGILTTKFNTLAPIVKMRISTMLKINGFPNDIWGWGAEDTALQRRAEYFGTLINKNFIDNYNSDIQKLFNISDESKDRIKDNNLKNVERYNLNLMNEKQKLKSIYSSGLNNLNYKVLKKQNLNDYTELIKVCIDSEVKYYGFSPKLKMWYNKALIEKNKNTNEYNTDYAIFPRKMYKKLIRNNEEKIYDYCFMGGLNTDSKTIKNRAWIIEFIKENFTSNSFLNFTDKKTIKNHTTLGEYDKTGLITGFIPKEHPVEERNFNDSDYYNILCKSKFCLCPAGDSIYSMRFYEAIMCKCIPIVYTPLETFRSKAESKIDYSYYLTTDKHEYSINNVKHNLGLFIKYHTLKNNNLVHIDSRK